MRKYKHTIKGEFTTELIGCNQVEGIRWGDWTIPMWILETDDNYDVRNKRTGTFEVLEKEYEDDRERIRKVIQDKYLLKFGKFDESKTPSVLGAIDKLNSGVISLNKLTPTKKSYDDKLRTGKYIREALELLNGSFSIIKESTFENILKG